MTQFFEKWVFIVYSATLAASGAVAVTQLGASTAHAFIAGFGVGALALDPVLRHLKRRETDRRQPLEDDRDVDGGEDA